MASARNPLSNSIRDRRTLSRPTLAEQTKTRGTPGVATMTTACGRHAGRGDPSRNESWRRYREGLTFRG
jgi:hypothetical protein